MLVAISMTTLKSRVITRLAPLLLRIKVGCNKLSRMVALITPPQADHDLDVDLAKGTRLNTPRGQHLCRRLDTSTQLSGLEKSAVNLP